MKNINKFTSFRKENQKIIQTQTKIAYATNHFGLNRWILQWAGLWQPQTNSKVLQILFKIYAAFVFVFVNLWFTSTEIISVKDTKHDLEFLIKNINFALTHVMGAVKCVFWFTMGSRLRKIIDTLQDTYWHYEDSVDFSPGTISEKAKKRGLRYTMAFFMLAQMTLSSSYLPAFISAIKPAYEEHVFGNVTVLQFNQRLPYFSWIPWSYDTPGKYLVAIFYQAGPMWSYAFSIVGMDTLFMNIMNFIASQLLILKGAFRTVRERSVAKLDGPSTRHNGLWNSNGLDLMMKKEMKKCIQHLQMVLNMSEESENIHKYLTLGQIMATLFILCTSLFLVSTTPVASKQFAAEIVYMIAMGFQLVLYCWFGNNVTITAAEIPDSIWHSDWLQSSLNYRKDMLITMTRMRKPVYMTVGKFAPLTLATFGSILKASYSFFAVLKKVNE